MAPSSGAQQPPAPATVVKQVPSIQPAKPVAPAATPAATPPAVTPEADASVVVVGSRPSNRIDRQVYDVKSDPGASNNTASDALNKVPSVAVDPDGTVTLRGSTNVQILIDGKPSAMLQGENRGAALNALPAEDIDSIEVINTPGAQFGNEAGGGPILNLVMRRNRRPGGFATINANAGSGGRHNAAVNGSYNTGAFGFQGSANLRHDGRDSRGEARRTRINPATGVASRSTQSSVSEGLNDVMGVNGSLTWNLNDKDTLAASAAYSNRGNDLQSKDRYVNFGSDDIADSDYERSTMRTGDSDSASAGARWEHKGDARGEVFKADLRVSTSDSEGHNAYANSYTLRPPGVLDTRSRQSSVIENRLADLTGDYELPGASGVLKLGYKVSDNRNSFDTRYTTIDPATQAETVNPMRTNRFALDEENLALYGSYEWRLGDRWGVLGGLRAEHTRLDIDQQTSGIRADNSYTSYIPSFFVNYNVSEDTDVRLSYARRIRRPGANDLNPFVIYRDEFNVSSGNPNLMPTETDSLELGLETKFGKVDTNLRAYYRHDANLISERRIFISDTVLLTTRDNRGSNQAGGLEFTLSGRPHPKLSINISGNLAVTEQRVWDDTLGGDIERNATSLSGRARFNWQASKLDTLQVMLNAQGKTLFGQGYRQPSRTADLSYRRSLTPALSLVLNVNDAFNSNRFETVTDTTLLKENNMRRFDGRVLYLGLSYRLGGFGAAPGRGEGGRGQGNRPPGTPRGDRDGVPRL